MGNATPMRFYPLLFGPIRDGFSTVLGADDQGRLHLLHAPRAMLMLLLYAGSRRTCLFVQPEKDGLKAWPDAAEPCLPREFALWWAGDGGESVREEFLWGAS